MRALIIAIAIAVGTLAGCDTYCPVPMGTCHLTEPAGAEPVCCDEGLSCCYDRFIGETVCCELGPDCDEACR